MEDERVDRFDKVLKYLVLKRGVEKRKRKRKRKSKRKKEKKKKDIRRKKGVSQHRDGFRPLQELK